MNSPNHLPYNSVHTAFCVPPQHNNITKGESNTLGGSVWALRLRWSSSLPCLSFLAMRRVRVWPSFCMYLSLSARSPSTNLDSLSWGGGVTSYLWCWVLLQRNHGKCKRRAREGQEKDKRRAREGQEKGNDDKDDKDDKDGANLEVVVLVEVPEELLNPALENGEHTETHSLDLRRQSNKFGVSNGHLNTTWRKKESNPTPPCEFQSHSHTPTWVSK